MSAYVLNLPELEEVRESYPALGAWRQTLECSVMDLADDITYALHDLDDFYRVGVLTYAEVEREFRGWLGDRGEGGPGAALEALRQKMHRSDPWIADDERFAQAVRSVRDDLVEGVLTVPFDGSLAAQRNLSSFVSTWLAHLQASVVVTDDPPARSGYIRLAPQAWHEIAILKFVHRQFVLRRPELGIYRSGQEFVLGTIVEALDLWLQRRDEGPRVPARLLDLINLARLDYQRVLTERPELLEGRTGRADLERMSRGRGICDYVASLTDAQAQSMARTITGHPVLNWGSI
jgi:dGTPase